jgi:ATP-dependent RNA helicase DeaD
MTESSRLFEDLPKEIQDAVRDLGWDSPMPVQTKAIPLIRDGRDLMVQAITGSGKTGAFGIPIVEATDVESTATQALIMAPTRELAGQVAAEVAAIGKTRGVRVLAIYGGVAYGPQLEGLERGAHVVVGTPGRILDHLGAGRMSLGDVRTLVLDEADELLSLGFWPDMREIASYVPSDRQSHLFSATIPEKVRSLARFFLTDPEFVAVDPDRLGPQEIEHYFCVCVASEKESLLARIIEYEEPDSAIIFCNTKADVRYVTSYLQRRNIDADQISGDLSQSAREYAIARIKAGELRFLVATDVAARGLDISDLSHVISYATADSPEVYIHRTGRTGRAGKSGIAISLVSGLDIGNFQNMQNVLKIRIAERKPPTEEEILARIRERLQVKVEHEMRSIPKQQRGLEVDRLIPVVEAMSEDQEGRRDLAAICTAYLKEHRPETTVPEPELRDPPHREGNSRDRRPTGRRQRRPRDGGRGRGRGR